MKKVSCMTEHTFGIDTFGILFQKKLERANPFLNFERISLVMWVANVNIDLPVNIDYYTSYYRFIITLYNTI
jgi:hypothetical protein